jgi:hypothetical protein
MVLMRLDTAARNFEETEMVLSGSILACTAIRLTGADRFSSGGYLVRITMLGLLFIAPLNLLAQASGSAQTVFQRAAPSVVIIEAVTLSGVKRGSAVAVRPSQSSDTGERLATWLITNAHVVDSAQKVIGMSGDRQFNVNVEYSDLELDVAILLAESDWLPVASLSEVPLLVGAEVFAIGNPRGLTNTISGGLVSGIRDFSGLPALQISAAIAPGSSGGGLFDGRGKLVGITTARLGAPGEALNFALPIQSIRRIEDAWVASQLVELAFLELFENAGASASTARSQGFVRWLAAPAQDSDRRFILGFQAAVPGPDSLETDRGEAAIAARYVEYQKLLEELMTRYERARPATSGQHRSNDLLSDEQVLLACSFSGDLSAGANPMTLSFVIDLNRNTVNGKPAEIDERRIRQTIGNNKLIIDRVSATATFMSANRSGSLVTGSCQRISQKAF